MSKILWINPVGTDDFDKAIKDALDEIKQPQTQVDVVSLKRGPRHLEYRYYEALVIPETLHLIKQAEKDGYDAAVIGCFYDPGLHDAREIVEKMVVTAPAEACMHIAATLGHKFSIIVGRDKWIPQMMDNVVLNGLKDKLASFKSLGLGVYDFHADEKVTIQKLKDAAKEAVEKDGAEAIILGCTIQFGFYKELQEYVKVPVIDAIIGPFKYAEFLVELKDKFGWLHSKKYGFETPPLFEIKQWELEKQYDIKGLWDK
ncbi:hydantoin racemase [Biomaibacter acetigenes]|uniref:Hydantoin racemase n=1 Tax=Biomaibacter acetigenes TaxID=2316383 RepID=A0A3G2R8K1_9FIRM|nr:aspartate/glutamate racemase family protein [Biomaibacter acetigenes]AYO31766.1 hydantoin racemase [Biomaibacter acetigenes]MDN5300904.1 allantoin racemase [Thermoanaerobacteraceae bacterium]